MSVTTKAGVTTTVIIPRMFQWPAIEYIDVLTFFFNYCYITIIFIICQFCVIALIERYAKVQLQAATKSMKD